MEWNRIYKLLFRCFRKIEKKMKRREKKIIIIIIYTRLPSCKRIPIYINMLMYFIFKKKKKVLNICKVK